MSASYPSQCKKIREEGCNVAACEQCISPQSCGRCQVTHEIVPFVYGNNTVYLCKQIPCPYYITNCQGCTRSYDFFYKFNQIVCAVGLCAPGYTNVKGECVLTTSLSLSGVPCSITNCIKCYMKDYCNDCASGYRVTKHGTCEKIACDMLGCLYCSLPLVCKQCFLGFSLMRSNITATDTNDI